MHEKSYEILISLPSAAQNPTTFRRTNQEFENRDVVVQDVRGKEGEFSLDKHGVCWRSWNGPDPWIGIDSEGVKQLGHIGVETTYLREVEAFIKQEVEEQDDEPVDRVKVFDYKVGKQSRAFLSSFELPRVNN